jgi:hypothetical protein
MLGDLGKLITDAGGFEEFHINTVEGVVELLDRCNQAVVHHRWRHNVRLGSGWGYCLITTSIGLPCRMAGAMMRYPELVRTLAGASPNTLADCAVNGVANPY